MLVIRGGCWKLFMGSKKRIEARNDEKSDDEYPVKLQQGNAK